MGGYRRRLGARGEELARRSYEDAGYEVLASNWRCDEGELDLICRSGSVLVVCEVKARSSSAYGSPAEAVSAAKQRRIHRLAARWLREHDVHWSELRFDVAEVRGNQVEVLEEAF